MERIVFPTANGSVWLFLLIYLASIAFHPAAHIIRWQFPGNFYLSAGSSISGLLPLFLPLTPQNFPERCLGLGGNNKHDDDDDEDDDERR